MYGVNTKEIEARLPHLTGCCCGCKLRTGSIIIGYLSAVFALLSLIVTCNSIAAFWDYKTDPASDEVTSRLMFALMLTMIILDVINMLLSIFMISGATMNNSKYLMPWVVYHALEISIYMVGVVISMSVAFSFAYVTNGFYVLFTGILMTGIQVYCVLVVFSFYRELTSKADESKQLPQYPIKYGTQFSKVELI